jgi:hypothetical protein
MVGRLGAGCRVAGAGVSADALRCPYVLRHARHAPNSIEPVGPGQRLLARTAKATFARATTRGGDTSCERGKYLVGCSPCRAAPERLRHKNIRNLPTPKVLCLNIIPLVWALPTLLNTPL